MHKRVAKGGNDKEKNKKEMLAGRGDILFVISDPFRQLTRKGI